MSSSPRWVRAAVRGRPFAEPSPVPSPIGGLSGRSPGIRRALEYAALAARLRDPVVIVGETGTGKGVFARHIHRTGFPAPAPFQTVSGPELAEGLFQSQLFGHVRGAFSGADSTHKGLFAAAAGGTFFVDELHLMPQVIQAAFLRALQESQWRSLGCEVEQRLTCRFIVAVQRPLEDLVREGRMLPDLHYRLGEFLIELPPLRERIEDLPELAAIALSRSYDRYANAFGCAPRTIGPDALVALVGHDWPGNVRELESVITRAAAAAANSGAQELAKAHLPERFQRLHPPLSVAQRRVVVEWYFSGFATRVTRAEVASALGVSQGTVDNDRHAVANAGRPGQGGSMPPVEGSSACPEPT